MIIRSQDKKSIATDLNINIYEDDERNAFEMINKSITSLGTYSTEEKAIKVLDMICDFYSRTVDVTNNIVQATKEDSYVFQMPQDSEV